MARSQKHGNREAKKPKKIKAPVAVQPTDVLLAKTGTGPGTNKRRG